MAHHNTDIWRIAGPVDGAQWGMFPNGGAWLTTHLWQHYLYTGNKAFLQKWYPVIKGAAEFYLDYMQTLPGTKWKVTVPSVSPEQGPKGKKTAVTAGCTMDNQIAFDALTSADVKKPFMPLNMKGQINVVVPDVFEYDLNTQKGKFYILNCWH